MLLFLLGELFWSPSLRILSIARNAVHHTAKRGTQKRSSRCCLLLIASVHNFQALGCLGTFSGTGIGRVPILDRWNSLYLSRRRSDSETLGPRHHAVSLLAYTAHTIKQINMMTDIQRVWGTKIALNTKYVITASSPLPCQPFSPQSSPQSSLQPY